MKSIVEGPHPDNDKPLPRAPRTGSFPALVAGVVLPLLLAAAFLPFPVEAQPLIPNPRMGVRLASGFEISLYADASLADDIQAMTVDSQGRVVVTGPGYIRTLVDRNNDGTADAAVDFGPTQSGGMGLCFSGGTLLFSGDNGLWRYADDDLDGVADMARARLVGLKHGEHGVHGIRQGPDGSWFVMVGNDGEVPVNQLTDPRSPVRQPQAGCVLRLNNNNSQTGVFSHGLRNPYDLDFSSLGDLVTYDSDVEREFLLPWYTPTRLYHLSYASHHGWRLPGYLRSFKRPDSYVGVMPVSSSLGRGSPTGVVCYRHLQFPPRHLNGLFLLDWTFGRVWFTPLIPDNSTYQTDPVVFLEPLAGSGFAPTDVVVAPDGSLLVSVGGRKTRGGVYRIRYTADPQRQELATYWRRDALTDVLLVLEAPQPLDAWSRAIWQPEALKLGSRPFDLAVGSAEIPDSLRIRAIEVLTEVHGGMMTATADAGSQAVSPFVRARVAWSLGRIPCTGFGAVLTRLGQDASPFVRRSALEAVMEQMEGMDAPSLLQLAIVNSSHPDKRVRQLAAGLAMSLPLEPWKNYFSTVMQGGAVSQLGGALAAAMRYPTNGFNAALAQLSLKALRHSARAQDRLEAYSLLLLAMGDWRLDHSSVELFTAYAVPHPPAAGDPLHSTILKAIKPGLDAPEPEVGMEAARLIAVLQPRDPTLPGKLLARITPATSATSDFHFLTSLARLPTLGGQEESRRTADALISIPRKLDGLQDRPKQTWNDRAAELHAALLARDPRLASNILNHFEFVGPGQVLLARALPASDRAIAARKFLPAVHNNPGWKWSPELVRLLSELPAAETHTILRAKWTDPALRDEILRALARVPQVVDREKYSEALGSHSPALVVAAMHALLVLPADPLGNSLKAAMTLLQRSVQNPQSSIRPAQVVSLINRLGGQSFRLPEETSDGLLVEQNVRPVMEWYARTHPEQAWQIRKTVQSSAEWAAVIRSVNWEGGSPVTGEAIYNTRGCALCHGGAANLGPDLAGATKRWAPEDLFHQIRYPSLIVPDGYRAHRIKTRAGNNLLGVVAFYSADGLILKLADGQTLRLDHSEILSQEPALDSIMPDNLMDGMTAQSVADLYAFMKARDEGTGR